MERTAHMSKARLRRLGLGKVTFIDYKELDKKKPSFEINCLKGLTELQNWIEIQICHGKSAAQIAPCITKSICRDIVKFVEGKWKPLSSKNGALDAKGCQLLWDQWRTFFEGLCK